ncbi:MAG: LysM peptidoglycan-binding domain-containing protein [Chitinispirillales bacterium]|jgi:membrane-bound lytic murein transglycosylase D|nr:LysM peptidoglycan-binding domain-containing protein [Chitinispirillales bacterium]
MVQLQFFRVVRFLLGVICVLLAAFAGGCASSVKKVSFVSDPAVVKPIAEAAPAAVVDTADEVDPTEPEVANSDSTGIDLTTDIDELLRLARKACDDSAYTVADSILRKASAFLMLNSELPDSGAEWFPLQDYIADIISMYAEHFPAGFSAPEEISSMIFSRHLLESLLDSLKVSSQDSVFLARLSGKRGVTYDIPVVWNDRVKRALLFYLRTRKGIFDRWLYRAGYYLPVMKQMFADSGLPRDLAHLPIIESGFNAHAYSRAHAAGIWQFIPSTGKMYGLRQNYWIDERRDPIKSTGAAIRYLGKLYGDFNNWHIALASYNCGENGMARAINRAGGVNDYWALSLPRETMNYVPLFLAAMVIAKNPDVFDFEFPDGGVFDPDTVFVNDCVEMKTIADGTGVALDTLTTMNPHILHWCTPPDMRDVRIYLPKGYADIFREFYDTLPDAKKTKFYRYTVRSGDNLLQIARNFRVSVDALREINKIKTNSIAIGNYIIVPIAVNDSVPSYLASHLNTVERVRPGRRGAKGRNGLLRQGGGVTSRTGKKITYKVRTGETLYSISNTFGVEIKDLLAWNYLANPRSLKAEQTLVIYQQGGAPASSQSEPDDEPASSSTPTAQATQPATPLTRHIRGNTTLYSGKRLVKQGETLYGIAQELGVPVSELAKINGLNARRPQIFPGDVLVYTPRAASEASANRTNAGGTTSAAPATSTAPTPQPSASTQGAGQVVIYTVKTGDNLWRIALNFGVTVDSIRESNKLTPSSVIMPGDILRIVR